MRSVPFFCSVFFLVASLAWFFAPVFLIRFHEFLRKNFLSETLVIWKRKRIAVLFLVLSLAFFSLSAVRLNNGSAVLASKPDITVEENIRKAQKYYFSMDYDSAAKLLEQAVIREPENALALERLGSVYWEMGREDEAMILWESAISRGAGAPRFREFYYNMKKLRTRREEEKGGKGVDL